MIKVLLWLPLGIVLAGTEWIGVSKRSWGACITQLCAAIGQAILGGMIYFIRDWRLAQFVTAAPFAVIAFYIWSVWTMCTFLLFFAFIRVFWVNTDFHIMFKVCTLYAHILHLLLMIPHILDKKNPPGFLFDILIKARSMCSPALCPVYTSIRNCSHRKRMKKGRPFGIIFWADCRTCQQVSS